MMPLETQRPMHPTSLRAAWAAAARASETWTKHLFYMVLPFCFELMMYSYLTSYLQFSGFLG